MQEDLFSLEAITLLIKQSGLNTAEVNSYKDALQEVEKKLMERQDMFALILYDDKQRDSNAI